MCGIIYVNSERAMKMAISLTIAQDNRGKVSTGVAWINNNEIKILKDIVEPKAFQNKYKSIIENNNAGFVIAHNRQPSQGTGILENAHPFLSCNKKYSLVHNGTEQVEAARELLKMLNHKFEGNTDSEVLLHLFEEFTTKFDEITALKKLQEFCGYSSILILSKEGKVFGFGSAIEIIRDSNGIYLASSMSPFIEVFGHVRKWVYTPGENTLFTIDKNRKITFYGEFEKVQRMLREDYYNYMNKTTETLDKEDASELNDITDPVAEKYFHDRSVQW